MRRSASEIIRNLESRIARLENRKPSRTAGRKIKVYSMTVDERTRINIHIDGSQPIEDSSKFGGNGWSVSPYNDEMLETIFRAPRVNQYTVQMMAVMVEGDPNVGAVIDTHDLSEEKRMALIKYLCGGKPFMDKYLDYSDCVIQTGDAHS